MGQEDMRKGPWTEQEDLLLINIVGLFGDRRWDFVAKVSGLNRTGKSCRLRWVNYLHPGLKRGKMTPQEEKLVLELHAKWGNRWSRIARKIPGRTDNEIKNYWRTHMRKKAQETKKVVMSSPTTSSDASSESSNPTVDSSTSSETGQVSFYDTGGHFTAAFPEEKQDEETSEKSYSMDDIWKEIDKAMIPQERCNFSYPPPLASPAWDYWSESLWRLDDEESKMLLPLHKDKQFMDYCEPQGVMFLT